MNPPGPLNPEPGPLNPEQGPLNPEPGPLHPEKPRSDFLWADGRRVGFFTWLKHLLFGGGRPKT